MKKRIIFFVNFILLLYLNAFCQELTIEKRKDIFTLIDMTGAAKIGEYFGNTMIAQMNNSLIEMDANVPDSVLIIVEEEIDRIIKELINSENGLKDMLCNLYHKYYTHNDIKELIKFYKTKIGKKVIRVLPMIMRESISIGQRWEEKTGQVILDKLIIRLKSRGIDLSNH